MPVYTDLALKEKKIIKENIWDIHISVVLKIVNRGALPTLKRCHELTTTF